MTQAERAPSFEEPRRRTKVLIIDDEPDIVEFIEYNLRREQFDTRRASDGPAALRQAREEQPDIVLLDLMLPGIDGLEVCRQLRQSPETAHIPIIMLTAKGEEADVVSGLEVGADDYVPKPFSMRLLLARMRAVLRRQGRSDQDGPSVTHVGELHIDDERHQVTLRGRELQFTLTEYKLLRFLARNAGRAYTRSQILGNIQDEHVLVVDRAIDVHVAALRRKLGEAANIIETVRGVGYRFKV
ncbi:MAG TPA: response regulator transcription factor [Candidatus Krumholzibacteria bacterium]|nr:response regulator transcription factor [Candidatus Krumholzibacteria bacterium]